MFTFASDPQIRTIVGMMADRVWEDAEAQPQKFIMRAAAIKASIMIAEDPAKYGQTAVVLDATELGERINQTLAYAAGNAPEGMEFVWAPLSRKGATNLITWLKDLPVKAEAETPAKAEPVEELEAGMYRKDGVIYKVQRAVHGSGKMYAKVAHIQAVDENGVPVERDGVAYEISFTFAPGAVTKLTAGDKMSYEEAKEFGALYGTCVRCGRTLTDELSVALGIGPVCGKREFGEPFKAIVKAAKLEIKAGGNKELTA